MALTVTLPRTFSIEAGMSHVLVEAGRLSFFACLQRPLNDSPLVQLSRHERGTGRRLIVGPLMVEVALT